VHLGKTGDWVGDPWEKVYDKVTTFNKPRDILRNKSFDKQRGTELCTAITYDPCIYKINAQTYYHLVAKVSDSRTEGLMKGWLGRGFEGLQFFVLLLFEK
jgi:hypothetical protein